ncbi:Response regulator receiver domain-containing protein [Methylomagnum ishizawai]|uniref:Response regulator receiver domain-containing protein n=1 Tax=Methylomagnum ishizawai TaxID=1760988 RepID=A0A1Y6D232_9GAMM|nr:fused response regulator/phosphatase [Methylomagnum ishizawai]SMF96460.1 Response regulator receiver domain-containing protein [Methylomagnum ishizawai]
MAAKNILPPDSPPVPVTAPPSPMRLSILVAEDSVSALRVIMTILSASGHTAVGVGDGIAAVREFQSQSFDLVLLDILMPGMDGFEATRAIKRIAAERDEWVPVLLISAVEQHGAIVKGLSTGADDFIPKPWLIEILDAKIDGFAQSIQAIRQIRAQEAEARDMVKRLAELNAHTQTELDMANRIMNRLVSCERLIDPQVRYFLMPSDRFSGDVVAISRAPNGTLYAMLADATGHGLTAAISVLPALWVFEGMARKGMPVADIATEINRRLKETLPTGYFVAAHIVALDNGSGKLWIWSGGMPPALLIDDQFNTLQVLDSPHVALGILGGGAFDPSCQAIEANFQGQCLLYSDGVIEARAGDGPMLGEERLRGALLAAEPGARIDHTIHLVEAHLSGQAPPDDTSLLAIRLSADGVDFGA